MMEANALSEALCFTLAAFCCGCSSFVAQCFFVDVVEAQHLCLVDVVEAQCLSLCLVC